MGRNPVPESLLLIFNLNKGNSTKAKYGMIYQMIATCKDVSVV